MGGPPCHCPSQKGKVPATGNPREIWDNCAGMGHKGLCLGVYPKAPDCLHLHTLQPRTLPSTCDSRWPWIPCLPQAPKRAHTFRDLQRGSQQARRTVILLSGPPPFMQYILPSCCFLNALPFGVNILQRAERPQLEHKGRSAFRAWNPVAV